MARYALIVNDNSLRDIKEWGEETPPTLAAAKGLKWVPVAEPTYDPATQKAERDTFEYASATQVTFTVMDLTANELRARMNVIRPLALVALIQAQIGADGITAILGDSNLGALVFQLQAAVECDPFDLPAVWGALMATGHLTQEHVDAIEAAWPRT